MNTPLLCHQSLCLSFSLSLFFLSLTLSPSVWLLYLHLCPINLLSFFILSHFSFRELNLRLFISSA